MNFQSGQRVRHYEIQGVLARGGMATVWRAWDTERREAVAVKAIAEELMQDLPSQKRFFDEIRRHARLEHPRIVPIIDIFSANGQFCMVMKLIGGQSLAGLLDRSNGHRLKLAVAVPIVQDLLAALDYAHQRGIVHRDVKPSNILLNEQKRVFLTDFGIALGVGEERRTRTGRVIGTAAYMSPEQIRTPLQVDHRADVYSVGCVLYEMLVGRPPFVAPARAASNEADLWTRSAHCSEPPIPPIEGVPGLPPDINTLILWALNKDPDKRLSGCQEFSRLLSMAMNHPAPHRPSLRSPGRAVLALGALGLWLVALGIISHLSR
jgi:eukaryotic-like serine/threonine-protein kinase